MPVLLPAMTTGGRCGRFSLKRVSMGARGGVVVPQVVVDELEAPFELAGLDVQRHDRIGPAVVAGAKPAPVVGAGAPGRDQHCVAGRIGAQHRPGVAGAGVPVARVGVLGRLQRLPGPEQLASLGVKTAHDAGRHGGAGIVVDGRAHHDDAVEGDRRRGHVVLAGPVAGDVAQADLAAGSEGGAGLAGGGVHRHQPRIQRGLIERARRRRCLPAFGSRQAARPAVDQAVAA